MTKSQIRLNAIDANRRIRMLESDIARYEYIISEIGRILDSAGIPRNDNLGTVDRVKLLAHKYDTR